MRENLDEKVAMTRNFSTLMVKNGNWTRIKRENQEQEAF